MFARFLHHIITRRLKDFPVVLLTGPRQAGKSTIMNQIAKEHGYTYLTFDSVAEQATAMQDPVGYIKNLSKPVVLDEVQRVSTLILPIKEDVDKHRTQNGQYALTGSANILLAPKLGDALTGRMALLSLWPLSQGEIAGKEETFLEHVFARDFGKIETIPCSKDDIINRILVGGFPGMQEARDEAARTAWCDSYLSLALLALSQIDGLSYMPQLILSLASRVGSVLNYSNLASECQISLSSCRRYMALLQGLFLLYTIPAWSVNLGKRFIKAHKLYFVDTAILLNCLRFNKSRLLENPTILGKTFENFVINELSKQISWSKKRVQIFHCRFSDNLSEIDVVLEDERGKVVAIEIKASETVGPEDFKHIGKIEEAAGKNFLRGLVLYAGDRKLPFGENRWALPISYLWKGKE